MTIPSPIPDRVPFTVPFPLSAAQAQELRREQLAATSAARSAVRDRLIASVERSTAGAATIMTLTPRRASGSPDGWILYIHGGAYILGGAVDLAGMLLADALGMPVHSIEYSLSPEVRYPVALDECVGAYRELAQAHGGPGAVIGVSAGASLALSTTLRLREEDAPLPRALGLATPWTDLDRIGDSYYFNDGRDPVLKWAGQLDAAAAAYAGGASYSDPLISPVYAEYTRDFPPSMITTGTRDLFLSNCVRLQHALRVAGATSELRVWEGMWHGFLSDPTLPEAAECRAELASFVTSHLA